MEWKQQGSSYAPVNKTVLDNFSESAGGSPLYKGLPVGTVGPADTTYMKYSGKMMFSFGDSITVTPTTANSYANLAAAKLNAQITNFGSSGADHNRLRCIVCGGTSSGGFTFTAPNYTGVELITIKIGHNAGVGSQTTSINDISGISDFNSYPDTFFGNVCRSIEYIQSQNQSARIYLLTPIQSLNPTYINSTGQATTWLKTIGSKYALPVIDLQNTSGLHFRNLNTFTSDGTHPITAGAQKIAEVVFRQILNY